MPISERRLGVDRTHAPHGGRLEFVGLVYKSRDLLPLMDQKMAEASATVWRSCSMKLHWRHASAYQWWYSHSYADRSLKSGCQIVPSKLESERS